MYFKLLLFVHLALIFVHLTNAVDQLSGAQIKVPTQTDIPDGFVYLGQFGTKAYYYGRRICLRPIQASEKCAEVGMKLARIDNTEEINWLKDMINAPTNNRCDNPWTDGELILDTHSFHWRTDRTWLSSDLPIELVDNFYLWLGSNATRLNGYGKNVEATTLCYLEVSRPQSHNLPGLTKPSREHDFDKEQVFPILPESRGKGMHAELHYMGTYHGKEYYIGTGYMNQGGTQYLGRLKCTEAGMNLAKIDSPEEMAWLSWVLPGMNYWTDGEVKSSPAAYQWASDNSPLNSELDVGSGNAGLALDTRSEAKLVTYDKDERKTWYLCYQYRFKA